MDNERNANIYFLFNSLINSDFLADKSLCSRSQFSKIVSLYHCQFIYLKSRTRDLILESTSTWHAPSPWCFYRCLPPKQSSSLSLSCYQLANSKPLIKLPQHVCLNHWVLLQSHTMTVWWTMGRKKNLKSITLHNTKSILRNQQLLGHPKIP
jgi:hypothetical protein